MASNSSCSIRIGYEYLFIGLLMISSIRGLAQSASLNNVEYAKNFLFQYGYLPYNGHSTVSSSIVDSRSLREALENYQKFSGLRITGELDAETLQRMSQPRCGVSDAGSFNANSRAKRYVLQGSRWPQKDLTYRINKFARALRRIDVINEIARAFNVWSEVTDLTFTPKESGSVDINISFERGYHGDHTSFDGEGHKLAHAYFPIYGGTTHFDDDEKWSLQPSKDEISLYRVAVHEFGHALGLRHSEVEGAVMQATYNESVSNDYKLHDDDIAAIQAIYGRKTGRDNQHGYYPQPPKWGNRRTINPLGPTHIPVYVYVGGESGFPQIVPIDLPQMPPIGFPQMPPISFPDFGNQFGYFFTPRGVLLGNNNQATYPQTPNSGGHLCTGSQCGNGPQPRHVSNYIGNQDGYNNSYALVGVVPAIWRRHYPQRY